MWLEPVINPYLLCLSINSDTKIQKVWKSWDLLKHGFLEGIKDNLGRPVRQINLISPMVALFLISKLPLVLSRYLSYMNVQCVKELTMVQLSVGMATGAAYLGSKVAGHYLPR